MAQIQSNNDLSYDQRFDLAITAIQTSQISSIRHASKLYEVPFTTLRDRLSGRITRHNAQINNRKLTTTEEKALLQRVKSLDNNGFSPTLPFVEKMANQLLKQRLPTGSVGKNWLRRWVRRNNVVMAKHLHKYDYQRAKCEDPEILGN